MNLSWLALALIAFQLLSSKSNKSQSPKPDLTEFLSDDTKNMIDCFSKLSSEKTEDKLGAIMQAISNPTVMNIAQSVFASTSKKTEDDETFVNDEGYEFEKPSPEAKDFFQPIEHIADPEVKNKLYTLYNNWYLK